MVGKRTDPRPLLLLNLSKVVGVNHEDPLDFIRSEISLLPLIPFGVQEYNFEFGRVLESPGPSRSPGSQMSLLETLWS